MAVLESVRPKSTSWGTPEWILEHFRPFFDPCPLSTNAPALLDGLSIDWPGFTFLNPPYGAARIGPWIRRAIDHGNIALLLPARTESGWFQALNGAATLYWFPRGRLRFISDRGLERGGAHFPSVIACIGERAERGVMSLASSRPGLLVRPESPHNLSWRS